MDDHGPAQGNRRPQVQGPPGDELVDAFVAAARALVGIAVRSLGAAPVEVTLVQHRVLVLLAGEGDRTVGAVAERLGVDQSNASRVCDRLQRLHLVSRRRSDEDGRAVVVALTPAGRELLRAVDATRRREVARLLDRLPDHRRDDLLAALVSFTDAAGEATHPRWAHDAW